MYRRRCRIRSANRTGARRDPFRGTWRFRDQASLRYLELSYQVIQLPPFFRNPEKRLAKMPKVHFVDPGILRTILNRTGDWTGEAFLDKPLLGALVVSLDRDVRYLAPGVLAVPAA